MKRPRRRLREVYPNAPYNDRLRVHHPPRVSLSPRTWHGIVWGMIILAVAIFVFEWLGGKVNAHGINELFAGSGVTYDDDGDPNALAGTWLERLMWGSAIAAALTYGLLRLNINGITRGDTRIGWQQWAAQRGLAPTSAAQVSGMLGLPVFRQGRDRDWEGLCTGYIGAYPVVVGATAWTTGSGKSQERHHMFFASVQMPQEVGGVYPSSSCTRFLRGIIDVDLEAGCGLHELRLESGLLDRTCNLRVGGSERDPRWRELFDPVMMVGLAEHHDVQWQQQGQMIAFCTGGWWHNRAPVETLDTLCAGGLFVVERFVQAARGDHRGASLAG